MSKDKISASSFNVSSELFRGTSFQHRGLLTHELKYLLTLPTEKRNSNAILRAITELEDIVFFQKFPTDTKFRLVEKMLLDVYEADEFLFKQGDSIEFIYLILSGVVALRYNICENSDLNKTRWPEKILRRGDVFGEIDLLQNRPSSVDAYTVGYSELLKINREDFNLVSCYLQEDMARLKSYVRGCEPLVRFDWSQEEWEVLEIFSEIRNYEEEVEIFNGHQGSKPRWSYFIVSGECKLYRDIVCSTPKSICESSTMKNSEVSNSKSFKRTVEFETGKQGFFFGVGEDFGENKVLATPAMECLLVLRLVLVFKNKELLLQMAKDLEDSFPSDDVVMRCFKDNEKISREVELLINNVLKEQPWRRVNSKKSNEKPPFIKYV